MEGLIVDAIVRKDLKSVPSKGIAIAIEQNVGIRSGLPFHIQPGYLVNYYIINVVINSLLFNCRVKDCLNNKKTAFVIIRKLFYLVRMTGLEPAQHCYH